jgi:hypothetical protein
VGPGDAGSSERERGTEGSEERAVVPAVEHGEGIVVGTVVAKELHDASMAERALAHTCGVEDERGEPDEQRGE